MLVSLDTLTDFARNIVSQLPVTRTARAHVVGLRGDLGAGKTTLVQHIARMLGVTESVTSPTFVIAERYPITHAPFTSLVHIDAYRLTPGEVRGIGLESFFSDPHNLVLVEWPENLGDLFPSDAPVLELSVQSETERTITHA